MFTCLRSRSTIRINPTGHKPLRDGGRSDPSVSLCWRNLRSWKFLRELFKARGSL